MRSAEYQAKRRRRMRLLTQVISEAREVPLHQEAEEESTRTERQDLCSPSGALPVIGKQSTLYILLNC